MRVTTQERVGDRKVHNKW